MSSSRFLKPPVWEGNQKTFDLIVTYLEELTGFEGSLSIDDLLVEDVGLDSLDFLELFFKIQTYVRSELNNHQLNKLLLAELNSEASSDSKMEGISLYSRLRIRHLVGLVRRQLSRPLNIEGFDYSLWRQRFFPEDQSDFPAGIAWKSLIVSFKETESNLVNRSADLENLPLETLEYFWLQTELSQDTLENYIRTNEDEFETSSQLEERLNYYLENENVIKEIRILFALDCVLIALDKNDSNQSDGDEWQRVVQEYVNKELTEDNLGIWIEQSAISSTLTVDQHSALIELLRIKMVEFIRFKIDQILNSSVRQQELVQDFIQDEYSADEPALFSAGNMQQSQTRIINWYVRNNRTMLIREFREGYFESILEELQVTPEMEPYSNNQKIFMASYSKASQKQFITKFSDIQRLLEISEEFDSDQVEKIWGDRSRWYFNALTSLRRQFKTSLSYLMSLSYGSRKQRIGLLMLADSEWLEILNYLLIRNGVELQQAFVVSLMIDPKLNMSIFRDLFLQIVLDWEKVTDCIDLDLVDHKISQIEKNWCEFELHINDEAYLALDIFLYSGLEVFSEWSKTKIISFLSDPTDHELQSIVDSHIIQNLSQAISDINRI